MPNMDEICARCGREIDWCNCIEITKDRKEKPGFKSSGRVSVPADFITAVRELCAGMNNTFDYEELLDNTRLSELCYKAEEILAMLPDEPDTKGEPHGKANDDNRGY